MSDNPKRSGVLSGLKVLDFGWAIAAPVASKCLGDCGATVVKVESFKRVDPTRGMLPMAKGIGGINRSLLWTAHNTSKHSICVDLSHPKGLDIAKELVKWADIVMENFTPKTLEKLGLGYEVCMEINPSVIMVRASLQGQEGPYAQTGGFGITLQALTGCVYPIGYPEQTAIPFPVAITDYMAVFELLPVLLAALDYRERTGHGCCIDLSQYEAGVIFITPSILDYVVNGQLQKRRGNTRPYAAPHGAYRCLGDDRWCVIAVCSQKEWESFCRVIGNPQWTTHPRFATVWGRKENEAELNKLIEEWTINYSAEEVMRMMQSAGVSAGIVENGRDLHEDPQLQYRHHFSYLDHPEIGKMSYDLPGYRFSHIPMQMSSPPCLGQDTEIICREILGMGEDEFVDLYNQGVFC